MIENQEEEDHSVINELLSGEQFPASKEKDVSFSHRINKESQTDSLALLVISNLKEFVYCIHLYKTHPFKAPENIRKIHFKKRLV